MGTETIPVERLRLSFDATVQLEDAPEGEGGQKRTTFKGIANSGKPFRHWFWDQFAVNLEGLHINKRSLPVLFSHDSRTPVGYTTRIEVTDAGLEVEGVLLQSSEKAREIAEQSREGYPWQMSIAVPPRKILELEAGEKTTVNGHEIVGPGHIFEEADLREVTFTSLGADEQTEATVLSARGDVHKAEKESNMSKPLDVAKLREQNPEAAEQLAAEAREAERKRISAIQLKAKGIPADLVQKCIDEGKSADEAASLFLEHLQSKRTEHAEKVRKHTETSLGGEDGESDEARTTLNEGKADPAEAIAAMPEGPEKFEAEYAASKDLQEEFGSKELYLSWRKNQGRGRVLSAKEVS